jgi:F-type H+-transporting ATPase subunit b
MPQFDFTTYSSQIFWFAICFCILYFAVSYIITPRIRSILEQRKKVISSDLSSTADLKTQIEELKSLNFKINQDSAQSYHQKIEATTQKIQQHRQDTITNLKKTLEENSKKSQLQLQDLIKKSQEQSVAVIDEISKFIKSKILN